MELIRVSDKRTSRMFLDVTRNIYKDDPVWVCPLDQVIEDIFDPQRNIFFTHGEAARWVLKEGDELIGRVAAFINYKKAYSSEYPVGGMGFFECIDDQKAAHLLFDTCRHWLEQRGMKAMDGPINFGENDSFWGLLVEGFTHPGYGMNYNPPYYRQLFENYGFKRYYCQITKHLQIHDPFPERFWKIADWILQKPEFTFRHLETKKLIEYVNDFKKIYDEAWQWHENFAPIEIETLIRTFEESRVIIDEDLIWFAYYRNEPCGFFVVFPDLNQIIKPFNGKLHLVNKLRLVYRVKTHKMNRARMLIFGITPKVQRYGVEAGLIWHLNEAFKKKPWYKELELSWVGDFNPKMQSLLKAVGGIKAKEHWTMRKLFDENLSFLPSKPSDEI